ncbi:NAD-dependent epimerase/dehydratase family protein [Hymenobacter sp. BT175]|uniref:NAD-dependent epimerase/dehydratase family protein n=1 Tax=Hymenobacter translucens TaxID=2886507 RepID=UPI001D0E9E4C|nr:NAD-dependent epimerase/dehydratase family protein [Hymenobacter translucens]MCC2547770.1 NAD-dependent epimerase/dehydratase family protein [Hymenobacter translucens]
MKLQKTALIAGASGLVGSQLLPLLLASDRYAKVIAVGRRPLPVVHPKLEQRVLDLDRLEDHRLSLIADDVYCCLGTTIRQAGSKEAFYKVDFLYVVKLAALTAANFAAQLLVVSAMGADAHSMFYYNRVKGEMEDAVRKTPFRAIHIFRPSLLLGERTEKRLGERLGAVVLGVVAPLLVGPLRRYRAVPALAVAKAMLRAAEDDGGGILVHLSDEIAAEAEAPPLLLANNPVVPGV